jgi:hypothetical protein
MVYFLAIYTIAASAASLRHGRPEATFRGQGGSQRLAAHGAGLGTKSSVRCRASSRADQPPLPTLAGFDFIAEDVAGHSRTSYEFAVVEAARDAAAARATAE